MGKVWSKDDKNLISESSETSRKWLLRKYQILQVGGTLWIYIVSEAFENLMVKADPQGSNIMNMKEKDDCILSQSH